MAWAEAWELLKFVLIVVPLVVFFPLIVLVSIPVSWLYPDRHLHIYDIDGTPHQRARLAQWRATYDRLGCRGRLRRARVRSARRKAVGRRFKRRPRR